MRRSHQWLRALATALVGLVPVQGFGYGETEESVSSPPAVQLAATGWDYYQKGPLQEPTPPAPPSPTGSAPAAAASNGSCCCDLDYCCDPERSIVAMVEATFFFPQFNRDFLSAEYSNPTSGGTVVVNSTAGLGSTDGSLNVGPRLTFGVQGERWGILARYWNGTSWATGIIPADPTLTPAGLALFDSFQAYTADLEVQRRGCLGAWDLYGFGGVRYGSVNNDRTMNIWGLGGGGAADSFTNNLAAQQFNGTGVTFGFWGTRALGCSPFKLFVANRYSVLWGTGSALAQTTATVPGATATNGAFASNTGDMFIGELQLGLQWEHQLACLPGRAFIRTAIEYQYWDTNAGVNVGALSFADNGTADAASLTTAGDMLFDLLGFNVGAGILF